MKIYPHRTDDPPRPATLNGFSSRQNERSGWIVLLLVLFCSLSLMADVPAPGGPYSNPWLDYWPFNDTNNWTSVYGFAAVSSANLSATNLGVGGAVVIDSTDPAWLQYNVTETDGTNNLDITNGSVMFWFAPNWASTSLGGSGPGGLYGPLIETGIYTSNASVGWWSLYFDSNAANIYFSAQTNSGLQTNYLSAPIAWTNGQVHLIVLNYTPTNSQLFLDGTNAASGPGVTIYPNATVLNGGFWVGSASNGVAQTHGAISDLSTYNYPLDSNTINATYTLSSIFYGAIPNIAQAPSEPETSPTFEAITGPGYLTLVSSNSGCGNNSNVWITNTTATVGTNGVNLTFTIAGGSNGLPYDVFATAALTQPLTNGVWTWMGQGYQCCTYTIPGLTNGAVFLLLGTPLDSDGDGLTDAYERLVSHTNPYVADSSGDGMLDGWKVLWGMNPLLNNPAQSGTRVNYVYDGIGRLESATDTTAFTEIFGFDAEGNITSDQQ
jgi:hypothetical protein